MNAGSTSPRLRCWRRCPAGNDASCVAATIVVPLECPTAPYHAPNRGREVAVTCIEQDSRVAFSTKPGIRRPNLTVELAR